MQVYRQPRRKWHDSNAPGSMRGRSGLHPGSAQCWGVHDGAHSGFGDACCRQHPCRLHTPTPGSPARQCGHCPGHAAGRACCTHLSLPCHALPQPQICDSSSASLAVPAGKSVQACSPARDAELYQHFCRVLALSCCAALGGPLSSSNVMLAPTGGIVCLQAHADALGTLGRTEGATGAAARRGWEGDGRMDLRSVANSLRQLPYHVAWQRGFRQVRQHASLL